MSFRMQEIITALQKSVLFAHKIKYEIAIWSQTPTNCVIMKNAIHVNDVYKCYLVSTPGNTILKAKRVNIGYVHAKHG